jgi:hypothetical protein
MGCGDLCGTNRNATGALDPWGLTGLQVTAVRQRAPGSQDRDRQN